MAAVELKTLQEEDKVLKNSSTQETDLSIDSPQAFEKLFKEHYQELCRYCLKFVKQGEVAEEIVQDVFVKLWQMEQRPKVHTSVKSYLFTSVKNSSLNYLKSQYARQKFEDHRTTQHTVKTDSTQEAMDFEELSKLVAEAVEKLPQQCRTVFEMSRSGGFTYQEISQELSISPKTVENQMGIALKKLKEHLRTYWEILFILLVMLTNANGTY